MSCLCNQTQNSAPVSLGTAPVLNSDVSTSGNIISTGKICNKCLFFWIAIGVVVLLLLTRRS